MASDLDEQRERRDIIEYLLLEVPEAAPVSRAEKVTSERIYGHAYNVWDVEAADGRYWVITNPTNYYPHEETPSMHKAFAIHIGTTARMMARQAVSAPLDDERRQRFEAAWRRYEDAAEALNQADEAEDFQAVGMRARECLLTFITGVQSKELLPDGVEPPKRADFIHWADYLADHWAAGSSSARIRSYLKTVSKTTWELVNWLTHAKNAYRLEAMFALDATADLLVSFTTAEGRFLAGETERCPKCGSYMLTDDYDPDEDVSFRVCRRCDWQATPREWEREAGAWPGDQTGHQEAPD